VVVCDWTVDDEDVDDVDVVAEVEEVALVVESSDVLADVLSSSLPLELADVVFALFVAEAAVWVVVALWPSRQAMTPPSESIVATLSAAAALRARAARGLRRGRRVRGAVGVGSSMATNVRMPDEQPARGR
jgi:hypothetical protein